MISDSYAIHSPVIRMGLFLQFSSPARATMSPRKPGEVAADHASRDALRVRAGGILAGRLGSATHLLAGVPSLAEREKVDGALVALRFATGAPDG